MTGKGKGKDKKNGQQLKQPNLDQFIFKHTDPSRYQEPPPLISGPSSSGGQGANFKFVGHPTPAPLPPVSIPSSSGGQGANFKFFGHPAPAPPPPVSIPNSSGGQGANFKFFGHPTPAPPPPVSIPSSSGGQGANFKSVSHPTPAPLPPVSIPSSSGVQGANFFVHPTPAVPHGSNIAPENLAPSSAIPSAAFSSALLVPYISPPGRPPRNYDPLLALAYHTTMKCVVCTDCMLVVADTTFYGHLVHDRHKPKDGTVIVPNLERDVNIYLATLELDYSLVQRPPPWSVIPSYSWLEKPRDGWLCKLCGDYAAPVKDTLRSHINSTCKKSDRCPSELKSAHWATLVEECSVQRFGNQPPIMSYFRVFPSVSTELERGSHFTSFLSDLPDSLKKGAPLFSTDSQAIQTKEFDLPPFLAKTKWPEAIRGYSLQKMVKSVIVPPKDDQLYGRLRPIGKKLLTSIQSTTQVPHAILNGLNAYKTKKKPFNILTDDPTTGSYGTEAVRFVTMLLRQRKRGTTVHVPAIAQPRSNFLDNGTGLNRRETRGGTACIEDEEDEELENEENDTAADEGMDNWEDDMVADNDADDEEDSEDSLNAVDNDGQEYFLSLSETQKKEIDSLQSALERTPRAEDSEILDLFADIILQTIISQPPDSVTNPYHTSVEVYLISRGIGKDGGFRSSRGMSNTFSKLQYTALYTVMRECIKPDKHPLEEFDKFKKWLDPDKDCAFASIRRYHRLAYQDARNYVAPPDIQFFDRFGTQFTYKGRPMDIEKFAEVIHGTYREAEELLRKDLLFGLSDEQLGNVIFDRSKADNTSDSTPGYGILATERDGNWTLMKHIMENQDIFAEFFDVVDGKPKIRRKRGMEFLEKIAHFRRLEYVLIHWLAGMPKRGGEEIRFKIINLIDRMRNFYLMYNRLSILGLHNKTSANTGRDNVTLHFLPPAIATLIQQFHYFVADLERWIVGELFPPSALSKDWPVYLFTSYGKRWKSQNLSDALKNQFKKLMGDGVNIQQFRHILPAITTHYNIAVSTTPDLSILDHQMGHTSDIGGRYYSRTTDGHHQLTNKFCHDSLDFCIQVHKLWGFNSDTPSIEESRTYRKSIADKISGAEEKALRDQIQAMDTKLNQQMEINNIILAEVRSLRELFLSDRNQKLGPSQPQFQKYQDNSSHPASSHSNPGTAAASTVPTRVSQEARERYGNWGFHRNNDEAASPNIGSVTPPNFGIQVDSEVQASPPSPGEQSAKDDFMDGTSFWHSPTIGTPPNDAGRGQSKANPEPDVAGVTQMLSQLQSPSKASQKKRKPSVRKELMAEVVEDQEMMELTDEFKRQESHSIPTAKASSSQSSKSPSKAKGKAKEICSPASAPSENSRNHQSFVISENNSGNQEGLPHSEIVQSSSYLTDAGAVEKRGEKRKHVESADDQEGSKAQKSRQKTLRCHECNTDIATLEDAKAHFMENRRDKSHTMSVKRAICDSAGHKMAVNYYRQKNLMFECYCRPNEYFETKGKLLEHLDDIDKSPEAPGHWAAYKGQNNKSTW